MNVYDQLLMEFPGIETTLTSYSSECHGNDAFTIIEASPNQL